jgi:hypothetical protein
MNDERKICSSFMVRPSSFFFTTPTARPALNSPREVFMPFFRTLVALCFCASLGMGAELRTLAGTSLIGDVLSIDDKTITIKTEGGDKVATPLLSVLQLELQHDFPALDSATKYIDVALADGSLLHCRALKVLSKEIELELLSGQKLKVPLAAISYVLNDAQDQKTRDEWKEIVAKKGERDILAIKAGGAIQRLEGTFGDGDEKKQTIAFDEKRTGQTVPTSLGRVHGLIIVRKPDENAPETLCKVFDTGNNILAAAKIAMGESSFVVTTVSGAKIEYPRAAKVEEGKPAVARLDFSGGRLVFLSDIDPVRTVEKSNTGRIDHYRRNKGLEGGDIRFAAEPGQTTPPPTFAKGLAIHAYTELVYDLGGQYKKFDALLGVDESVEGDSDVKVTIEADGKEVFADRVKRGDKPKAVKLEVKDVKELRIVVRSSDLLDFGNQVALAEARVSK